MLFMDAYGMWIKKYGLEDQLSTLVEQYFTEIDAAMAKQSSDSTSNPQ